MPARRRRVVTFFSRREGGSIEEVSARVIVAFVLWSLARPVLICGSRVGSGPGGEDGVAEFMLVRSLVVQLPV